MHLRYEQVGYFAACKHPLRVHSMMMEEDGWQEAAAYHFPDRSDFKNPLDVYIHAARMIVDKAFGVNVELDRGFNGDLAVYFEDADEEAAEIAKQYMALRLGMTAYRADRDRGDGVAGVLWELCEEIECQYPDRYYGPDAVVKRNIDL